MHSNIVRTTAVMALLGLCVQSARAQKPVLLEGHKKVISSLSFSRDGQRLVSGSWDESVRVWSVKTGKPVTTLSEHTDWVFAVVFSRDGKRLASASQHSIRRWNPASFAQESVQTGLGGAAVNSVAFSRSGNLAATGGRDGTVKLWRIDNDSRPQPGVVFTGLESWVNALAFSPDEKTLAAGSRTGRIRLFDLTTGKERVSIKAHAGKQVLALAVNPDADTLASGGFDATVQLWDLATGKQQAKLTGHKGIVTAVAWSTDGKRLASGERHGRIKLWNASEGYKLITTLAGHSDQRLGFSVTALAFSPDGRILASGGYDGKLKLWPLPKNE